MSGIQTQLDFPVRKSNRLRTKNKENQPEDVRKIIESKTPEKARRTFTDDRRVVGLVEDIAGYRVLTVHNKVKHHEAKASTDFCRKLELTPKKAVIDNILRTPPKRKSSLPKEDSSPSKISNAALLSPNTPSKATGTCVRPPSSARKQLLTDENLFIGAETTRKTSAVAGSLKFTTATEPSVLDVKEVCSSAKKALCTKQPDKVVCRDAEISEIQQFVQQHLADQRAGSLYISGAPGTGKTAVIKHIIATCSGDAEVVFINSMVFKSPLAIYKAIATELIGADADHLKNFKTASSVLCKYLTSPGKMVVLVLDEMDQLDSKNQEVLYTIFEWPSLPNSRLILIGIANALDLTDRILPRLHVRTECKPQLLHFSPYTKEQIVSVIESRLSQTPEVMSQVLDKSAVLFCARKVSAVAGDMRKALDICRRSIELTQLVSRKEELVRKKSGLSEISLPLSVSNPSKVGIAQVANVVDEVYGNSYSASKTSTFPLQQKLIACTLLLMLKSSKLKEVTVGKVHDSYCRVCKKRDVAAADQSEFIGLCQLLEARGIILIKKAKESRQSKITLKLDAAELEHALQDKLLITSVLEAGL